MQLLTNANYYCTKYDKRIKNRCNCHECKKERREHISMFIALLFLLAVIITITIITHPKFFWL